MRALPTIALAASTIMLLAAGCMPDEVDLNHTVDGETEHDFDVEIDDNRDADVDEDEDDASSQSRAWPELVVGVAEGASGFPADDPWVVFCLTTSDAGADLDECLRFGGYVLLEPNSVASPDRVCVPDCVCTWTHGCPCCDSLDASASMVLGVEPEAATKCYWCSGTPKTCTEIPCDEILVVEDDEPASGSRGGSFGSGENDPAAGGNCGGGSCGCTWTGCNDFHSTCQGEGYTEETCTTSYTPDGYPIGYGCECSKPDVE